MPENILQLDPDKELVASARKGDTRAFDSLIRKHSEKLHALVFRMTAHEDDTRELLQEVYAKAYRSLPGFREQSSFHTWIHQIAVNLTLNFLKKRKMRAGPSLNDPATSLKDEPGLVDASHRSNPEMQSKLHELQVGLNEAMRSLSEAHRTVVQMFDLQGIPHSEIARKLGVSEGTVRSRLHYAHLQLQSKLRHHWEQEN